MSALSSRSKSGVWRALVAAAVALFASVASADDVTVPVSLQLQLLARVATYDRSFAAQATAPAVVLVVVRRGNAESSRSAAQIEAGLRRTATLAGRPVTVERHDFASAAALRSAVQSRSAAIVYLTPGFAGDASAIGQSLDGLTVLSVSAVGADADNGIVLSFELVEARPKLVVNLRQARRQGVQFSSQFLRLARVIQ